MKPMTQTPDNTLGGLRQARDITAKQADAIEVALLERPYDLPGIAAQFGLRPRTVACIRSARHILRRGEA